MSTSNLLASARQRAEFSGRTSAYPRFTSAPASTASLLEDYSSPASAQSLASNLMAADYLKSIMSRISQFNTNWAFFEGQHYVNAYVGQEKKLVVNYCRKVVNVGVDFFLGREAWSVVCPAGNEPVADLLNMVWEANDRVALTSRLGQFGSVTGGSYVYVTVKETDSDGSLIPKEQQSVMLLPINPSFVLPIWHKDIPGLLQSALIQFPVSVGPGGTHITSLLLTTKTWQIWEDGVKTKEGTNSLGELPLVYVPSQVKANSVWGMSDLDDVIPVNEKLNDVWNTLLRILDYHGEPTTLIFGARVGDLDRGASKVWSNLPAEGRVENLELKTDLGAINGTIDRLVIELCRLSDTPPISLDGDAQAVSNTSGLAMTMRFLPAIQKASRKRTSFNSSIRHVNRLILKVHSLVLGEDLSLLADNSGLLYETTARFTSALPRDEKAELDAAKMKQDMGIVSKAENIRRFSDCPDYHRLIVELVADDRYALAMAYQKQLAVQGIHPNLATVFLSSAVLTEDLETLALKSSEDEVEPAPDVEDELTA